LLAAAAVGALAGAALAVQAIATGGNAPAAQTGGSRAAVEMGRACGVRIANLRVVDSAGRTLYREPGDWTTTYPHPHAVQCSGPTVWVVWDNGAAANQEGYVGARSADGGRTWRLVFAESFFGVRAPHELGSYIGPWTVRSPQVAYFTGWCPACSPNAGRATSWVWVTRDAGRSFRRYPVARLSGYELTGLRVSGRRVTISGKAEWRGKPPRRTATIRVP
jgi:hypothetical protein